LPCAQEIKVLADKIERMGMPSILGLKSSKLAEYAAKVRKG
jgi:hypothetical protein